METTDRVLLWLLLAAMVAFPIAVWLYLRTAYRKGGWREVKSAVVVAGFALLIVAGFKIWVDWEASHFQCVIEHTLAVGSIFFCRAHVAGAPRPQGMDWGDS